jgi:hypothetical protein
MPEKPKVPQTQDVGTIWAHGFLVVFFQSIQTHPSSRADGRPRQIARTHSPRRPPAIDPGVRQREEIAASVGNAALGEALATAFRRWFSLEIVLLEKVSETSSNASIGDVNEDGKLDIVLVKGRHWQVTTLTFFGDGQGHFTPGPPLPSNAVKSHLGSLAEMTNSGHLDMVLSNDSPDPKLVLLNDGKGNFRIGGTYGDPKWPTRNAAVSDLNGDGYPDIVVANRMSTSYYCLNDGKQHFDCRPLEHSPSAATVLIADVDGDGKNDIVYPCRDSCQSLVYFNDGRGISRARRSGVRRIPRFGRRRWRTSTAMGIWILRRVPCGSAASSISAMARAALAPVCSFKSRRRCPIR